MAGATKKLIRLVEHHATENDSYIKAQRLIMDEADITATTKNGYMIESVIAEEARHNLTQPIKALNCRKLIQLLQYRASELLGEAVLSSNGGNPHKIELLVKLGGNCNQENYGALGLVGEILKQNRNPIRHDVLKLLFDKDPYAKHCLTKVDAQRQTCLSLVKDNPDCSDDVLNCVQNQFDMILNEIPLSTSPMNINEVIEWIRRGANTEATDEYGNTVLSNAVRTNNLDLVQALITSGCDTACKHNKGFTPLQLAENATPRNPKLVALLTEQSINTELKRLIEKRKSKLKYEEVHALLERGANINSVFPNNNTLLHLLIINHGTSTMVSHFINESNADISATNTNGHRPIELCILFDKSPFDLLLSIFKSTKISTDIFFNSTLNKSILQFAIDGNLFPVAKIIQYELNIRLWDCIKRATTDENHNQKIMNEATKLIKDGAQIDHKHSTDDYEEWTVLHLACKRTTSKLVEYLIQHCKAKHNVPNMNRDYPISIAAENGQLSIVQYLRGLTDVQLNVSNKNKETPLHLATKNHHLLVVRYLILWGADHQAQNVAKQTPLDNALTNVSTTKDHETNDKKLISFLQRLICPIHDRVIQDLSFSTKPDRDLDTCELVDKVFIDKIQITDDTDFHPSAVRRPNILGRTPNQILLDSAKRGDITGVKRAIDDGADVRCRKHNRTAYEISKISVAESHQKLMLPFISLDDRQRFQKLMTGCQHIIDELSRFATVKLIESIRQSHSGRFLAYHYAGAPLTPDLVNLACSTSDNTEIVHYLINEGPSFFRAIIDYTTPESLYYIAKKKNFHKVANYLKYLLSIECTEAVKNNKLDYVKQLVRAGASVDMINTNNLIEALKHQNIQLIEFLCDNGIKIPEEWFTTKKFILPATVSEKMDSNISSCINRCLINRRLRWAAACGDFNGVIQCQRMGADINSKNCHGSTALLLGIQHGNYFRIVHTLISCGGTILHSNPNEPMSVLDIAKKHNYEHIINYLTQELNTQFMASILENNTVNAEAFGSLGANFNFQDEQKRTPLHYAIQYHSEDLVKWLCDRGSTPTMADINGDFPITLAVEKGMSRS